jgi:hypothetical protein
VSPIESAEQALELLGMAGACQRFLPIDQIAFDQLGQRLLQRERALLPG